MNRRDFLALTGLGLAAESMSSCASTPVTRGSPELYGHLVMQNDAAIPGLLARQENGALADRHGLYHAGASAGLLRRLAAAYVAPESRHARDASIVPVMRQAARHLLDVQHDDGTIDLLTTNFHSPPDLAFVLEHVCGAALVLRGVGRPAVASLLGQLERFIRNGARALAVGGIHTPNHRWVVCMALARANALYPDPRYITRIDEWLAEGIDIDVDGQFTERSTSIYSPLTDRCLATVARLLDRPSLYEPVRRNLEMTLYYVHADGEVATEGSRRQDRYRRGSLAPYYYPYRYMALLDGNGRFAAMARWIERTSLPRLTGNLIYMLEDRGLRRAMPRCEPLPSRYEKHFAGSDLVRIRDGDLSATILAGNPTFLSFHKGSAAVAVRFASAFFGKGQFAGENLRKVDDAWVMEQDLRGPYYQPLPADKRRADGDWSKMSRADRPQSEVQNLRSVTRVRRHRRGLRVGIEITGCAGVPVAVELGFRTGGALEGVRAVDGQPGAFLLETVRGRFRYGDDTIDFGPGRATHRWVQIRGALPKLDADSVYLTGATPFRVELELR